MNGIFRRRHVPPWDVSAQPVFIAVAWLGVVPGIRDSLAKHRATIGSKL